MEVLRSYVIRLYRDGPEGLAGVAESVETGGLCPFRSAEELWCALHMSPASPERPRSINPTQEDDE
jgi:hypothetical protein